MRLSLPPAVRSGRRAASGMLTVDRVTQLRTIGAVRLFVDGPQYDVADGIRHSLQWAAIRDDILPPAE
jgi:hypothetical protein